MMEEHGKQVELPRGELDHPGTPGHDAARGVHRDIGEAKHLAAPARLRRAGPAQQGADPGQQLVEVEGLDEVIVGARLQSGHAVRHGIADWEADERTYRGIGQGLARAGIVGQPPAKRPIEVQTIAVGDSVRGSIDDTDPFDDEEVRFDVFRIEGRPGQRVVARLQSDAFDAYLKWGIIEGDVLLEEASDDDSGGGTSAQLNITLDADGEGRLVVTSLGGGEGAYTVSIVSAPRGAQPER